jgi:hypothetical protein
MTPHDDLRLLRAALAAARDGLILAADLSGQTCAALTRWLTAHGPADAPYWPLGDVEGLLAGTDP